MVRGGEGSDIGEARINLAAAIQVIGSVTTNIGCMAGVDVAFDALESILRHRKEITQMIEAMLKAAPPDTYPQQKVPGGG